MTEMPKAATLDTSKQDAMRAELSKIEDKVLEAFKQIEGDQRWLAIARTDIQTGFMAAKRALYEGRRVGDA
jgi:hypothetical protein